MNQSRQNADGLLNGGTTLLLVVTALLSTGCGSSMPTSPLGAGPGVAGPATAPQAWTGAAVLGKAGETAGKTQSRTRFSAHDLIELRVDVGGTPPNVEVRATWLDNQGHVLGTQMQRSRIGQEAMVFASPAPGGLEPGNYRVQLRVAGEMVHEQSFEVDGPSPPAAPAKHQSDKVETPGSKPA